MRWSLLKFDCLTSTLTGSLHVHVGSRPVGPIYQLHVRKRFVIIANSISNRISNLSPCYVLWAQPSILGGWGVATSQILDWGSLGSQGVVDGSRNITIYRKYVRKWWLFKRNRIICPEVAVNGQFCLDQRKKRSFGNLCLENRNFL